MDNLNLTHITRIAPKFTAAQWDLYDTNPESAALTATTLNSMLEGLVNAGWSRRSVTRAMHYQMAQLASDGANDTEPRAFLERTLNAVYGEKT